MERTPFILALLLAVLVLVASNQGFRKGNPRNSAEITSYEYAKLHSAMSRHDEIDTAARQELTQDHVTVAQYNKIMDQVHVIELKQARQMAAVQRTAAR